MKLLKTLTWAVMALVLPSGAFADEIAPNAPAVSDFNAKFSVEGGLYDNLDAGLLQGSVTGPIGDDFGLQIDGDAGPIAGDAMAGLGGHLFTRDPSRYLLGLYGSYHSWNRIGITRAALEGEGYFGPITVSGVAGWEDIDVPTTDDGLRVLTKDSSHGFGMIDLSYYVRDNLRLGIGYHYVAQASLGAPEIEYMPHWADMPISLFARGLFGEDDHTTATAGIRFHFGPDKGKSLIRRDREDDPRRYTPMLPAKTSGPNTANGVLSTCRSTGL